MLKPLTYSAVDPGLVGLHICRFPAVDVEPRDTGATVDVLKEVRVQWLCACVFKGRPHNN